MEILILPVKPNMKWKGMPDFSSHGSGCKWVKYQYDDSYLHLWIKYKKRNFEYIGIKDFRDYSGEEVWIALCNEGFHYGNLYHALKDAYSKCNLQWEWSEYRERLRQERNKVVQYVEHNDIDWRHSHIYRCGHPSIRNIRTFVRDEDMYLRISYISKMMKPQIYRISQFYTYDTKFVLSALMQLGVLVNQEITSTIQTILNDENKICIVNQNDYLCAELKKNKGQLPPPA